MVPKHRIYHVECIYQVKNEYVIIIYIPRNRDQNTIKSNISINVLVNSNYT